MTAQVERANGWTIMLAIAVAKQAGRDWPPGALADQRRLANDGEQR